MPSLNTKLASAPNTQTNYVLKATSSTTIGNSTIQDTGSLVTVTSPTDIVTGSGIGSSGVTGLLRVVTAGTSTGIAIGQANSSRYTAIQPNEHIIYNDDFFMRTNGAFPLSLGTNNTIRMSITSAGNVGIGTSSPSRRLTVPSDGSNWITGIFGGAGGSDVVVVGNLSGPTIGGHNSTLTAWAPLLINPDGGNVGIGTRNPSQILDIRDSFQDYTSGQFNQIIYSTTAQSPGRGGSIGLGGVFTGTSVVSFGAVVGAKENGTDNNTAGYLAFLTRANAGPITEKMRLSSGGKVMVNTTDTGVNAYLYASANSNQAYPIGSKGIDAVQGLIGFFDNGNNNIGSIFRQNSSVQYNTSSDYRLKEDFKEVKGLEKVSAIKIYDFKWKNYDYRTDGVLAHELAEILPYAVVGEKDAVNQDGTINAQGVDYSKIVPVLVKAIQEQQAQIEELKALINK